MDYKALYQSKLTTPEEAVKCWFHLSEGMD